MSRYLCISVAPHDELFHGKGENDEPEWPPSPLRLFQALLAGSRTGCREREWTSEKAEAFRWLEKRRNAPEIVVGPEAEPSTAYTLFVPNNDSDQKFERQDRLASKIARPHRLRGHPTERQHTIHYLWLISDDEWPNARPHAELLCREARCILALGWGIDQVAGSGRILNQSEVAELLGRRWQAWTNHGGGQRAWRVPRGGTLDDLERVHRSFLNRMGPPYTPREEPTVFGRVLYLSSTELPPRPCAAYELPDEVAFPQANVVEVAAMLRSLACERAKSDPGHKFPGGSEAYVAGHVAEKAGRTPPRFSYLPLPTIGGPHADGMIRRLLIAEPHGGEGSHKRWAEQRLRGQAIRDDKRRERGVLLDPWRSASRSMFSRYVREEKNWSSVTPVVLPGFDDGRHSKAEKLCLRAIVQAGLPSSCLSDVWLRKAPFWPGSLHPRLYRRPDYLVHLPVWHVRIVFRERIPGPVSIGAGRHCGLGILAGDERG
jgi:CRISPR-associated protein Csb2